MNLNLEISWQLGVALGLAALLSALLAYLFTRHYLDKKIQAQLERNHQLSTQLKVEQTQYQQKISALNESRNQLKESFSALSKHALDANNESFLQLAQQKLGMFETQANANLSAKEKAIENLLKPVNEALRKTEKQITDIEKERKQAYGTITEQLKQVTVVHYAVRKFVVSGES